MDFLSQPTCSEEAKVKQKKDRDAPTRKSVVVLKGSDVTTRNEIVFMPNTIEMAQLKKPEKGQFKTVQFSRKMTKMDIERILVEIFPFLEHQRFYCAAAVDNRTRLDFHGEPRIWDGQFIKRNIKGNSALYIFTEEEKSGDAQGSTLPAQSTPKRTHDQITTQENEKSEQPSKKKPGCKGATTVPLGDAICPVAVSTITSGQEKFHSLDVSADAWKSGVPSVTNMVSQEKVSSMLTPQMDKLTISSASSTTAQQSDQHFQQTPAGLQHGVGIRGSCHHSKQSPDEKNNSGVAQATERHQDVRKAPVSDHESESEGQVASNSSTSDSGYDGDTAMSLNVGLFETAKPEDASALASVFPEIPQCEDMQDVITPELEQVVLKVLHNPSSSDSAFEGEKDTFCSAEHIFYSLQNLQDPISKITSKTNFSEALSKIASSQGLIISDNQGSGNCMFYALSEQLAAMKGIHISHEDLRQRIVQYLEMNPRLPDGTELFKFVNGYPSWADYLRNMSADGTWGDNLILVTAANCFKTSIRVVSSLSPDHDVTISPECGDDSGNVLMLGHVNQNHYVSLLPIPEVESIAPKRGPLEGGYNFTAVLYKELPEDFSSGIAEFEGVATVGVQRSSPFSLSGTVPCSLLPGDVNVTFKDQTGTQCFAKGVFCYEDMMWKIIEDPQKLAVLFAKLSQGYGLLAYNSNTTQDNGLLNLQHQGQTKQQQSLNVLLQVFYIAAERGAQQFIEIIFSTSAGQVVFKSYKDRTPLPEDVARANGHEDLAQYLQDVNTRLSKEIRSDVTSCAIDWLELVEAAQNQASVAQDQQLKHLCESDDNSSEYFADAETSSCGSFDLDDVYDTDSDSEESTEKEPCTTNGVSEHGPSKRPGTGEEGCSNKVTVEQEEPPNNTSDRFRREDTSAVHAAHYSSDGRTTEPKEPCTTTGVSKQGPIKRSAAGEEGCTNKIKIEQEEPPNNASDNHESCDLLSFSLRSRITSWFRREDTSAVHAVHNTSGKRITEPKEPCTTTGVSIQGPIKRRATGEEGCSNKIKIEQEEPPNNTPDRFRREDTSAVHAAHYSSGGRTTEPKEHRRRSNVNSRAEWPFPCFTLLLVIVWVLALVGVSVVFVGARAESWKDIRGGDEIRLLCPPRTEAIKNNTYKSHFVYLIERNCPELKLQKMSCCDQARCTTYQLTKAFLQKIKIINTAPGKTSVTQWKSELLTYIFKVELEGNRKVDEDEINVSSSVECLTVPVGQDISLCQAAAISPQTVQQIWWSIILPDGTELNILYCNSTFCSFLQRSNKSYPACLQRLKINEVTLIPRNVGKDDQELQFKCRTEPDMRAKSASPGPRVYNFKIKNVTESAAASGADTSRITCFTGETITILFERIPRGSLNDFSGYRVCKKDTMFGSLEKDSGSVYNCSDNYADLEQFCLKKTEFQKFNSSHLMLNIKNITAGDSRIYCVYFVFNNLERKAKHRSQLEVIEGKQYTMANQNQERTNAGASSPTKENKTSGFVISWILCGFRQTITIRLQRIPRGSLNDFSGYRVCKNDSIFGSLEKDPGSVYNCSYHYADLEQFCLLETEFVKLNASHMMLKIKKSTAGDSGNYSVYFVFNNLERKQINETHLEVIEGKQYTMANQNQERKRSDASSPAKENKR